MPKVVVIAGPTASGKSELALDLAARHHGVIINADSMQIYDALHVLTAQPDQNERAQAPHKLYGILHPNIIMDAVKWRDHALNEIRKAHNENQTPLIVGGTGFYIKALIEGLSPMPIVPVDIRADVIKQHDQKGVDILYQELITQDPDIKGKIDAKNPMRVMRAMEVFISTGKSLAYWQNLPKDTPPDDLDFTIIAVSPPRDWLYHRCNKRFEMMFDTTAVEEVRDLNRRIAEGDVIQDAPITKAIGYPEITNYLNGVYTKATGINKAQQFTRNYAKRQMTWLRSQMHSDHIFDPTQQKPQDLNI